MDVLAAMDVRVYPPPPLPLAASDHTRLGQLSRPEPPYGAGKVRLRPRVPLSSVPLCAEVKLRHANLTSFFIYFLYFHSLPPIMWQLADLLGSTPVSVKLWFYSHFGVRDALIKPSAPDN